MSIKKTIANFDKNKLNIKNLIAQYAIYIIAILLFVVLTSIDPTFASGRNIVNILKQTSIVAIIVIAQTLCLITGGMDLSSGSIMALAGVTAAFSGIDGSTNMFLAVASAIAVGMCCGLINGLVIAKGKVPAFIATLGMQQAARGMALLITKATPVSNLSDKFTYLGGGKVAGIPVLIFVMLFIVAIFVIFLHMTKTGRHIYAVGGNEQSAHVSGINVVKQKIMVYVIAGALAGIAGFLLAGRLSSGSPTMASGYELDAIAGAVIGGVSTTGGIGSVFGAAIGALLMSTLSVGLDYLNISAYYQQMIKGAIIVLAVLLDVKTKGKKK